MTTGHPHGAQAAPAGQAGQVQAGGATSGEAPDGGSSAERTVPLPPLVAPVPPAEVTPPPHAQSQGGQLGP